MRLTSKELDAISVALSELLAGAKPQGFDDESDAQQIMNAAHTAHDKILIERQRRVRQSKKLRSE